MPESTSKPTKATAASTSSSSSTAGDKTTGDSNPQSAPENTPPEALANSANPEGQRDVSTGPVGERKVIDAQEHVLGDDPRRVAHRSGYHDSLTGRPVTEDGKFIEESMEGQGPIPKHRIVSDNWPTEREKLDDNSKRVGNQAKSADGK